MALCLSAFLKLAASPLQPVLIIVDLFLRLQLQPPPFEEPQVAHPCQQHVGSNIYNFSKKKMYHKWPISESLRFLSKFSSFPYFTHGTLAWRSPQSLHLRNYPPPFDPIDWLLHWLYSPAIWHPPGTIQPLRVGESQWDIYNSTTKLRPPGWWWIFINFRELHVNILSEWSVSCLTHLLVSWNEIGNPQRFILTF